ncbi:DUF2568 domain-containing protein [Geodermatophilus sp. SYSU D00815]
MGGGDVLAVVQESNLALRLAVEVAALVALGMWGWHRGRHGWSRLGLTVGAPAAAAVVWALLAAPGSTVEVPGPVQAVVQVAVLGAATAALAATGRRRPAAVLAAIAVGNAGLMAAWGQ